MKNEAEQDIKVSDMLMEHIDTFFPKGDKKRGEVLVINAMAMIEGFAQGKKFGKKIKKRGKK